MYTQNRVMIAAQVTGLMHTHINNMQKTKLIINICKNTSTKIPRAPAEGQFK